MLNSTIKRDNNDGTDNKFVEKNKEVIFIIQYLNGFLLMKISYKNLEIDNIAPTLEEILNFI